MWSGLTCYADNVVKCYAKSKTKTLPYSVCPEKFLSVATHLPEIPTLFVEDEGLNRALVILGHALKGIYAIYGKKNLFTDPQISFKPNDNCVVMKIGMLSKEKWKLINKKRSVKEP